MPRLFSLAGIPSGELAFLRIFRRTDLMVAGGLPELVSGHFCQETIWAMPNVGPCLSVRGDRRSVDTLSIL